MGDEDEILPPHAADEALDICNQVATLMTEAGILPSGQSTGGLLLLAAGNSLYARRVPLSERKFLQMAAAAYRLAAKSEHVKVPLPAPKS